MGSAGTEIEDVRKQNVFRFSKKDSVRFKVLSYWGQLQLAVKQIS